MKTTAQVLEQAEKLECELALLTEELARSLQKPASRRDPSHLADSWLEITRRRPQLVPISRRLRKIKRPVNRGMKRRDYVALRKTYEQAHGFMRRFRLWDEMERIVQRHLDPERQALLPRLQMTREDDLLTRFYTAFHRQPNTDTQDPKAKKMADYVKKVQMKHQKGKK